MHEHGGDGDAAEDAPSRTSMALRCAYTCSGTGKPSEHGLGAPIAGSGTASIGRWPPTLPVRPIRLRRHYRACGFRDWVASSLTSSGSGCHHPASTFRTASRRGPCGVAPRPSARLTARAALLVATGWLPAMCATTSTPSSLPTCSPLPAAEPSPCERNDARPDLGIDNTSGLDPADIVRPLSPRSRPQPRTPERVGRADRVSAPPVETSRHQVIGRLRGEADQRPRCR